MAASLRTVRWIRQQFAGDDTHTFDHQKRIVDVSLRGFEAAAVHAGYQVASSKAGFCFLLLNLACVRDFSLGLDDCWSLWRYRKQEHVMAAIL